METRAHHVLIGAFTLGVLLLALGFVLWLSKSGSRSEFVYYDVIFTEAVTGLSKGGLVQYNGIKVGEVSQLKLAPDDPRKVIARIRVEADAPVRVDTHAKLGLLGLTGAAFIQLSGGSPGSAPLAPKEGDEVAKIVADESALQKLLASSEDVVTSINDVLFRLGNLVSKENVDRVSSTLQNLDQLVGTVADQRGNLAQALRQIADASGELKQTVASLNRVASTTDKLMRTDVTRVIAEMQKALEQIDQVAKSTSGLVDDNRAALTSFSNQGLRQVGPAVAELREALRSFKQLTDQLGENPAGFVLGRDKPKEFEVR
ncbi:MAG: MlaD family protein [Tahibacter sp.]